MAVRARPQDAWESDEGPESLPGPCVLGSPQSRSPGTRAAKLGGHSRTLAQASQSVECGVFEAHNVGGDDGTK
jgi:hypothetical protein